MDLVSLFSVSTNHLFLVPHLFISLLILSNLLAVNIFQLFCSAVWYIYQVHLLVITFFFCYFILYWIFNFNSIFHFTIYLFLFQTCFMLSYFFIMTFIFSFISLIIWNTHVSIFQSTYFWGLSGGLLSLLPPHHGWLLSSSDWNC